MRSFLSYLCLLVIVPAVGQADVLKYKAGGYVTSSSNSEIVDTAESFTFLFTLDTDAQCVHGEMCSEKGYPYPIPDGHKMSWFRQEFPLSIDFSGGFSLHTIPRSSEDEWSGREQHRQLILDESDNQTLAIHESGNNNGFGGHDFFFNEDITPGWIDLIFGFYEWAPPFQITSTQLEELPDITNFDDAGFNLTTSDVNVTGYFDSLILIPKFACEGFLEPMDSYPITVKKNRALPLKLSLEDRDGFLVSDQELTLAPVIEVTYAPYVGAAFEDVTDDAISVGLATEGNQLVFTDEGFWQYNLKIKNYSTPGIYTVRVRSTDDNTYYIDPICETAFVVQ